MTEISYLNKKILEDEIYIHDSFFTGFCYDYLQKQIDLSCVNYFLNKKFFFKFQKVLSFDMQSCNFWGSDNRILWIELVEESSFMKGLVEQEEAINGSLPFIPSVLDNTEKLLEIKIQISSGDVLFIICELVEFQEEDLK